MSLPWTVRRYDAGVPSLNQDLELADARIRSFIHVCLIGIGASHSVALKSEPAQSTTILLLPPRFSSGGVIDRCLLI